MQEAVCTTKPSFASAEEGKATSVGLRKLFTAAPLFSTALAVILHGILKDGVVTWAPTYLSETYGISASASVLTTVVLPCSQSPVSISPRELTGGGSITN